MTTSIWPFAVWPDLVPGVFYPLDPAQGYPAQGFSARLPAQGCRHKVTIFPKVLQTSSLAPAQGPAQGNPNHSDQFGARGRFRGTKHENVSKQCKTQQKVLLSRGRAEFWPRPPAQG